MKKQTKALKLDVIKYLLEKIIALYGKQRDERIRDLKKRSDETDKKLRELL